MLDYKYDNKNNCWILECIYKGHIMSVSVCVGFDIISNILYFNIFILRPVRGWLRKRKQCQRRLLRYFYFFELYTKSLTNEIRCAIFNCIGTYHVK